MTGGMEKSGKILESCDADLENAAVHKNFASAHSTQYCKSDYHCCLQYMGPEVFSDASAPSVVKYGVYSLFKSKFLMFLFI